MKIFHFSLLAFAVLLLSQCGISRQPKVASDAKPISHAAYDAILKDYVDEQGLVDYQGLLKDSARLNDYLAQLSAGHPNDANWSKDEQLAYWINAYNAFTLKMILDNYPVPGIKDIKNGIPFVSTVWDINFIDIEGESYNLNNLEHGIVRKYFPEPRVHFALVCASLSCPKLQRFAFTAEELDGQLDRAAREFLNEPYRNDITADKVGLSKILDWYWGDFTDTYPDRYALLKKYAEVDVQPAAPIEFLEYDWRLNEQTPAYREVLEQARPDLEE